MNDDLRLYAERILASVTKTHDAVGPIYTRVVGQRLGLTEPYELAAAYLAGRPDDDGGPVTAAGAQAAGWVRSDFLKSYRCPVEIPTHGPVWFTDTGRLLLGAMPWKSNPTWGDVRRLLAAIGAPATTDTPTAPG